MKVLVFTEGTILMHKNAVGLAREEIVRQVREGDSTTRDFGSCVPIAIAAQKLQTWKRQGAEISYLTSRRQSDEVEMIRHVLAKHDFPHGALYFRQQGEAYRDVAEQLMPDILVEDDCESIGGEVEMTYPHIRPGLKEKIKSIVVKEFGGIDHLPDDLPALMNFQ